MKTPVALIVFNRPEVTYKVLDRIRAAKPETLFVIADGPRVEIAEESELCLKVREIIDMGIDWPCRVLRRYSALNLGCGPCVATGLEWVFSHVDEAIILEDDCLPDPTFFKYCEILLDKYRYNHHIGAICGTSFLPASDFTDSIYFSNYFCPWGWASWKRSWDNYTFDLDDVRNKASRSLIRSHTSSTRAFKYWKRAFAHVAKDKHTWDFQFIYSLWKTNSQVVLPAVNLIMNLGFSKSATHTSDVKSRMANLPLNAMKLPLRIPDNPDIDHVHEITIENIAYPDPKVWNLFLAKIPKPLKKFIRLSIKIIMG